MTDGTNADDGLWQAVVTAIAKVRPLPDGVQPTPQTRLREDLGLESYDLLGMVFLLEERFDVNILAAMPPDLATVGEAHAVVASLIAGGGEEPPVPAP